MRQWRLLYDLPMTGAQNMAIDEAIMTSVAAGDSPPTLRFYRWEPACLSLGYSQKWVDADLEGLQQHGWDLVRRPTGGRAILHADELTYSVALPIDDPLAEGTIIESYRRISEALIAGVEQGGAALEAARQQKRSGEVGPICFEVPSHYEITYEGRKLIGSAQVRRRDGILQHGSLPLDGDLGRICDALTYPDEPAREAARAKIRDRAVTLSEVLRQPVDWDTAAAMIVAGFEKVFGIHFEPGVLSPTETAAAGQLMQAIYKSIEWTSKR